MEAMKLVFLYECEKERYPADDILNIDHKTSHASGIVKDYEQ